MRLKQTASQQCVYWNPTDGQIQQNLRNPGMLIPAPQGFPLGFKVVQHLVGLNGNPMVGKSSGDTGGFPGLLECDEWPRICPRLREGLYLASCLSMSSRAPPFTNKYGDSFAFPAPIVCIGLHGCLLVYEPPENRLGVQQCCRWNPRRNRVYLKDELHLSLAATSALLRF